MRAAVLLGYGKTGVVELRDMPEPVPGPEELLVRVHCASLNPLDFKIRDGKLRWLRPLKFPHIMGNDLAGTVAATGPRVTAFKAGDKVYARPGKARMGAFAEYALVHSSEAGLMPAKLSMEEAAAVPLAALTAWQALFDVARLERGQKILIHAGAGGVGSFAIQLAKQAGARVFATASGTGLEIVRRLGADIPIDYRSERFEDKTGAQDVIFDTLGGSTLERSFSVLKPGGVIVSVAGPPEPETARELMGGLWMRALFAILSWRIRKLAQRGNACYRYLFMKPSGEQLAKISALIDQGKIKPLVDRVFPLKDIHEALAYLETGRAKGKVVLKIGPAAPD